MTEKTTVELSELAGTHILSTAAILTTVKSGWSGEDADVLCIGIDGKTYTFTEDPSDGYRSYMKNITVEDGLTDALKLAPRIHRPVRIEYVNKGNAGLDNYSSDYTSDLIRIIDTSTEHLWAILGTYMVDDYYPSCVIKWDAMDPNQFDAFKPKFKKNFTEETAKEIAEAFGYDEVFIYGKRGRHDEHSALYKKDKQ